MFSKSFARGCIVSCLLGLAVGCTPSAPPPTTTALKGPRVFDSPRQAVDALVGALRAGDLAQLKEIFGPEGEDIISSGDPVADRSERERFLIAYDVRESLQSDLSGGVTLVVGEKDWPFPVPIIISDDGYAFDTPVGREEILNRRIGRNELSTIQVCLATVDAQQDYVSLNPTGNKLPVYARKLVSTPGMKDGLYWPTAENEPASPLGPEVAAAQSEGYGATATPNEPRTYHGYRYRLLTRQGEHANGGALDYVVDGQLIGGFAVVAYPAEYGKSGITSFITNHDGVVYQRDLGPDTQQLVEKMTEFDPGPGWTRADGTSQAEATKGGL